MWAKVVGGIVLISAAIVVPAAIAIVIASQYMDD